MKSIWLTSLTRSEDKVKNAMGLFKKYGLEAKGHFFDDDLEKMAWMNAREDIVAEPVALWAILGSAEEVNKPEVRYGLSLLALTVRAKRGGGFPVLFLQTEGEPLSPDRLPTAIGDAMVFPAADPGLGAKIVAKAHAPNAEVPSDFHIDLFGTAEIGQWFEIGPAAGAWSGVLFGVCGGEILFQAVGTRGRLPDKSVLNYPVQGMKIEVRGREYTAWAVQNEVGKDLGYFAKVKGFPDSILFGPYSQEAEAEVHLLDLK